MQAQLPLFHLYPVGEYGIVSLDLSDQFNDVFLTGRTDLVLLLHADDLPTNAVEEGHDSMNQRHLGAILGIAPLAVGHASQVHLEFLLQIFLLVLQGCNLGTVPCHELLAGLQEWGVNGCGFVAVFAIVLCAE